MSLTRDAILGLHDLKSTPVEVPEWGGTVYVRALNGSERDGLERMITSDSISRAAIAAMVTCDNQGVRLFGDDDVPALAQKHGGALERIVNAAMQFNVLTSASQSEAGNS